MKKSVRILAILLTILLTVSMLCGCQSTEEKYAALSGTWIMYEQDSEEQVMVLLESIDLYEEEIALVDMNSLRYAWTFEFDTAGNIRQCQPVEENKALVREFYTGMFDDFFENRASLDGVYETELSAMSREEFEQFYAELYTFSSFEELMDQLVENAYYYDEWEDLRRGTFTFKGNNIVVNDTVENDTYNIGYKIEGNTLTLSYIDGVEVYTKVQ